MTLKEVLIEFCEGNELTYSEDYSGRCMYGQRCFSITCDEPMSTLVQVCDFSNACDVLGTPRQDSMGLSSVLYFPYAEFYCPIRRSITDKSVTFYKLND